MIQREIVLKWIDKTLEQVLHAKLYISTEGKSDAKKLKDAFSKELDVLYEIEPEKAGTILISDQFKDKRFWVVLERVLGNPLLGFIKQPDGTMERVQLSFDPERERRIKLMQKDGLSLEEVEEAEGPLSKIERSIFK